MDPFSTPNSQTTLSCSHVFHTTCISNFERFTTSSGGDGGGGSGSGDRKRRCPVCRKRNYEKMLTNHGFVKHQLESAILIQTCWRAHFARKRLYEMKKEVYGQGLGSSDLRLSFLAEEVTKVFQF